MISDADIDDIYWFAVKLDWQEDTEMGRKIKNLIDSYDKACRLSRQRARLIDSELTHDTEIEDD